MLNVVCLSLCTPVATNENLANQNQKRVLFFSILKECLLLDNIHKNMVIGFVKKQNKQYMVLRKSYRKSRMTKNFGGGRVGLDLDKFVQTKLRWPKL